MATNCVGNRDWSLFDPFSAFMASPARTFSFCFMAADGRRRGHQRNRQRKNRYNHHEHDHRRRQRHRAGRFQNARDDLQRWFHDQRTRHGQRRQRPPARRRRTPAPHFHPALQQDEQRLHKKERAPHDGYSPAPQQHIRQQPMPDAADDERRKQRPHPPMPRQRFVARLTKKYRRAGIPSLRPELADGHGENRRIQHSWHGQSQQRRQEMVKPRGRFREGKKHESAGKPPWPEPKTGRGNGPHRRNHCRKRKRAGDGLQQRGGMERAGTPFQFARAKP